MAYTFRPLSVFFIIIAAVFLPNVVNSIPTGEFDSMLDTLRVRGYDLFCNAIVTSDLQSDLLFSQNDTINRRSYTFFAPMDSSLFALDMTQTASSYTDTLRFHVVPSRLSISDLLRLPAGTSLPTLLPNCYLNVTQSSDFGSVTINGVDIAFPGLFSRRHIVVHGLAGIISLRSNTATGVDSNSLAPSSDWRSFPPRTSLDSSKNYPAMAPSFNPVVAPTQMFNTFYATSRADSPPPMDNISPANRNPYPPASEPAAADTDSHATLPFNRAIYPPEPDESDYLVGQKSHGPEDSFSPAGFPEIYGISPASSTESSTSIFVLPPEVSHAFSPTSESPEYRHSAISAPPLEYSEAMVLSTPSPCMWRPKKNAVTPIETFRSGSDEVVLEKDFGYERCA